MDLLRQLARWLRPYWKQFVTVIVSMILYSAVSGGVLLFLFYRIIGPLLQGHLEALKIPIPAVPVLFQQQTLVLYRGTTLTVLFVAGGLVLGLLLVRALAQFVRSYVSRRLTFSVERDVRNELVERMLYWPLRDRQQYKRGDIMSRLNHDLGDLSGAINVGLRDLVQGPIEILTAFGIALYIAPWFAAGFVIVPVAGYLILRAGRRIRNQTFRTQTLYGAMMDHIHAVLTNLPTIKVAGAEQSEHERFVEQNERYTDEQFQRVMVMEGVRPLVHLMLFTLMLILIFVGYYVIDQGYMDAPTLMSVIGLLVWTYRPLRRLAKVNERLQSAAAAYYERLRPILRTENESFEGQIAPDAPRTIELDGVAYAYDATPVLRDLDLSFQYGEFVAIAGPNGAGKSTLLHLILGLYQPDCGTCQLDGQPLDELNCRSYRRFFAYVPQSVTLFARSLRANLTFGRPESTDEAIHRALRTVHLEGLIDDLQNGLDTNVQEGGRRFSGGERRRLALARALLAQPRFLVVDEPGRSIDPESRSALHDVLYQVDPGVIAVTHDVNLARQADRVVFLRDGQKHGEAPHDRLVRKNSLYEQFMSAK